MSNANNIYDKEEKPKYVKYEDYSKILEKFNKMKQENKDLKKLFITYKESTAQIEKSMESSKEMYSKMTKAEELLKQYIENEKTLIEKEKAAEKKREREKFLEKQREEQRVQERKEEEERERKREIERKEEKEREKIRLKDKQEEKEREKTRIKEKHEEDNRRELEREADLKEKEEERKILRRQEQERLDEKDREIQLLLEREKEFNEERDREREKEKQEKERLEQEKERLEQEIQKLEKEKEKLQTQILNLTASTNINTKKEDFTSSKSQEKIKIKIDNTSHILQKKVEEMEASLLKNNYNFSLLLKKYSVMQDDYVQIKDNFDKNNEKYNRLNQKLKKRTDEVSYLKTEIEGKNKLIERFREVDFCMLETILKSCLMNTKKSNTEQQGQGKDFPTSSIATNQNMNNSKGVEGVSYIICEPIPSIVKFFTNNRKNQLHGGQGHSQQGQEKEKERNSFQQNHKSMASGGEYSSKGEHSPN